MIQVSAPPMERIWKKEFSGMMGRKKTFKFYLPGGWPMLLPTLADLGVTTADGIYYNALVEYRSRRYSLEQAKAMADDFIQKRLNRAFGEAIQHTVRWWAIQYLNKFPEARKWRSKLVVQPMGFKPEVIQAYSTGDNEGVGRAGNLDVQNELLKQYEEWHEQAVARKS